MINTLLVTISVESAVCLSYSLWRRKPVGPILFTSLLANLITQPLLWIVLNVFFQHYLVTLLIAEILIWVVESVLLYQFPANQLRLTDAISLSLYMNLASFGIGWLLPF